MSRLFKTVNYQEALQTIARLDDCLPQDHHAVPKQEQTPTFRGYLANKQDVCRSGENAAAFSPTDS